MNYILDMYRQMFENVKRGNSKGVYCNAKPVLLISLLDYIGLTQCKQFKWGEKQLEELYKSNFEKFENAKLTPFWKPFFYMSSEPFYSLVWEREPDEKSIAHPSGKTLKTYLSHAEFDDELLELLQDSENRDYLRSCIIDTYFKK